MSEAIIARRRIGNGFSPGEIEIPEDFMITDNTTYVCPQSGNYLVSIVGGGAGGAEGYSWDAVNANTAMAQVYAIYGGNGGMEGSINSKILYLEKDEEIKVTIGKGGNPIYGRYEEGGSDIYEFIQGTGGTTAFGTYLSANGGSITGGYMGEMSYGDFGSDGMYRIYNGGNGGRIYFNNYAQINIMQNSGEEKDRLYLGDGGNGGSTGFYNPQNDQTAGNRGCCLIRYISS